ncbi:replication-relaxation family protein [Paeniglutamicibacter sp. NPDC091659]|uniref:replication-relaxation family protein n=1 Tax=Paeniglutamicibacter sp. NPDC091659 TaxID=3364389 RepID=UPI0037FC4A06
MRLTTRDASIIETVNRFGQLGSGHIWDIHFDNTNKNSMDRVLKRLTAQKLLQRIERRLVGGNGGGSGQYVYQLGSMGHDFLGKRGKFTPAHRTVKHHILEIVDAYIHFIEAEQAGTIRILNYLTEPDAHLDIAGAKLRPDLFIEYELVGRGEAQSLWIEVDRGFESLAVIGSMVGRYAHAMENATRRDIETVPAVLFLVPDERRQRNIQGVIRREAEQYVDLITVKPARDFITTVT